MSLPQFLLNNLRWVLSQRRCDLSSTRRLHLGSVSGPQSPIIWGTVVGLLIFGGNLGSIRIQKRVGRTYPLQLACHWADAVGGLACLG